MGSKISIDAGEEEFSISTPWFSHKVPYDRIDGLSLRDYEGLVLGELVDGKHGTSNVGIFRNEEFGEYDMASQVSSKVYIVMKIGDRHVVFTQGNVEATKALYVDIKRKIKATGHVPTEKVGTIF